MKHAWFKLLAVLALACSCAVAGNPQWSVLGPDGGDVRSLAYDPHNPNRILLGTSTGVLFISEDDGHSWTRYAKLGTGDDYVLDHIAFDPHHEKTIFVSAWSVLDQNAGDVFRTKNGGKDWEALPAMHNKSVRAMAIAASDEKVVVAGALDGVYRSTDGGNNWQRISANDGVVKNVESLAIDPKDPNTIYAGTWHLAWKTSDGGANWQHITKGMVDDSDVFSIIVSQANPSEVFASACSGIYKSVSGGDLFDKIKGIPFSARRTRVLKQDPGNPAVVYAGTTEGLWKTMDSGKSWKRVSNPEVVVNDVMVDPRNSQRVLLATDRSGVLASDDGAQNWAASNHGYTHRYVTAILADKKDPQTIFVGVVNDREQGGVFMSHDGGQHWMQKSAGLDGRDVFTLKQTASGELLAGTNRGMFMMAHNASEWSPMNDVVEEKATTRTLKNGKKVPSHTAVKSVLTAKVSDIEVTPKAWYAATSAGLFTSTDQGKIWKGGAIRGKQDFVAVQSEGSLIAVATHTNVLISTDSGETWQESSSMSPYVSNIRSMTITPDRQIMIASREGAFRSPNAGAGWEHMQNGLPDKNISSISYDETGNRLLATSTETGVVFESEDGGRSWRRGPDTGYPLRRISVVHGRFLAATPFDGVIVQPENQDRSAANGGMGGSTN